MEIPYKLEVLWCRTFQSVLKIGNYFMGYRMPKYLEGPGKIKDKGYRGERVDTSGPSLVEILKDKGFHVAYTSIIPDEKEMIKAELCKCADELGIAPVLTTDWICSIAKAVQTVQNSQTLRLSRWLLTVGEGH